MSKFKTGFPLLLCSALVPLPALSLEEVLVTATKREQNLQDVAVAVTALGADLLREAQITSSEDLTFLVPSLNLQKGGNSRSTSFSIRGIGTQSFSSAVEPSVSTMLDGVVMGRSGQSFMQLLDIERIEVLRGPQGTLFGKNSTGGVVHIITRNPSDEFEAQLLAGASTQQEYRAGLSVSGPITDTFGFRLSAIGNDRAGYTKNYFDGSDLNGGEEWNVRGKLRWFPTEELEIKWASDHGDSSCECTTPAIRSLEVFDGNEVANQRILDSLAPVQVGEENRDVNINKQPFSDSDFSGHSLEVNYDFEGFTVTSITAYRDYSVNGFGDPDLQPGDVFGADQFGGTDQEQFTQELRLTSPADSAVSYVAGLFYFDQHIDRTFRRTIEVISGSPATAIAEFEVDTTNWAAFGEATWSINEQWRLILGARYTEDELEFVFGRVQDGPQLGVPAGVEPTPGKTDENDLSGKVALQWDYGDAGMMYLSYSRGYKGPAFDVAFGSDPVDLPRIDPERSDSWEWGAKTSLFDDRLRLNAAVFYSVYEDFQSQAFFDPDGVPPPCADDMPGCNEGDDPGSFILINAGEVITQGIELDFLAQVTDQLRVSGGLAYIEAEIEEYPGGPCSGGQQFRGECPDGLQDLSGGELPFSPDWKGSVTATYEVELNAPFGLEFKGSVRAQDEVLYSLAQDQNTIADSYTIFDASVVLSDDNEHWDATFYVKNITDEFYVSNIQANNGNILPNGYAHRYSNIAERTFGIDLRLRWQ